ncbi:MAG: lamin tail domain-containing protein, partial [Verrucomicrobiales bacterium]|nr:lamin tail domain-containing protein [Verrucomicrobiales bacterium]
MPPSRPPFRALLSVLALLLTLLPGDARSQEIALSEIFYAATNNSPLATWFELHNPSSNLVALAGWRVTRGVEFLFPNDARIEPGGYLVVAADPPTFRSLHPSVSAVVGGWTGFLSPGGEEIRIEDANFRVVDEVTYAAEGDWAVRRLGPPDGFRRQGWEWHAEHRGLGASLERIHAGLPNEYGQNWGSSTVPGGTPGRPNSIARTATAPLVVDVRHLPTLPRSTDTVLVTATLIDDDATAPGATLFWRVDGETEFRTAALRDDGTGGDPMAGDGRYTARLPAHPDGTLVEYRLVANDAAGASRAYPDVDTSGAGDRSANLLYRVEDTAVAAEQPVFRLWMPRAEYAYLADAIWSGSPNSDAAVHGAFVASDAGLDGETTPQIRQLCGFRNRGHGTRTVVPHNFRVDFPADRPWKARDALNLNTHYTHSQQVGSTLFRRLGIPVPESRPVQVRVNGAQLAKAGQEQFGSYAANEPTDDRFVE